MTYVGNWILSAADLNTEAQRRQYLALDPQIAEILNTARELTKPRSRKTLDQNISDPMIIDSDATDAGSPGSSH